MNLSPNTEFRTAQTTTASTLEYLLAFCERLPKIPFAVAHRLEVATSVWLINAHGTAVADLLAPLEELSERLSQNTHVTIMGATLTLFEKQNNKPVVFQFSANQNELTNSIHLQKLDNCSSSKVAERLYEAAVDCFPPVSDVNPRMTNLPKDLQRFHLEQEKIFTQQRQALLEGNSKLQESIQAAHEAAETRVSEMRAAYDKRNAELEELHEGKLADLEKEKTELAKQKNDLDDRQRTHARRSHEKILADLVEKQRKFSISEETIKKRAGVTWVTIAALLIGLALIGVIVYTVLSGTPVTNIMWSMLVSGTVLTGSTLVYMTRWHGSWYQTHADMETNAQVYSQDFTRASWLMEFLFEWQKDNSDESLPPGFLNTLATGIFEGTKGRRADHPAAELLSKLTDVKVVEMDKKKVRIERDAN